MPADDSNSWGEKGDHAGEPAMHKIVEQFVSELPARVEVLKRAWEREADRELLRASDELRSLGAASGFDEISGRAAELEVAIRRAIDDKASGQSGEIRERFEELIELCERATCARDESGG